MIKEKKTQGSLRLLREVSGHSVKIFWLKEWQPWTDYKADYFSKNNLNFNIPGKVLFIVLELPHI